MRKNLRFMILFLIILMMSAGAIYVGLSQNHTSPYNAAIIFTFDDTYTLPLTVKNALPALQEYGYTAMAFISTGTSNYENQIPYIKTLINAGWEIASHAHTHTAFTKLSYG